MGKIAEIWRNKWVKFVLVSIVYILLFVVWTGNLWMLLGELVIHDIYISKYMYRWFWKAHKERKKEHKTYKMVWEWIEAIVFALVVTTFIRLFIFGFYVIPTPSMEKTLLVGDYLYVSKLAYGPQVPNTPLSFPLEHNTMPLSATKKSYAEWIEWPYHRLKGFADVSSGDVVVFNFPAGDTVVLERPSETYYDILRSFQAYYGEAEGRDRLWNDYTVISRPVDKRENYVKRCVGVPGDSLQVINSVLYVNGAPYREIAGLQYMYYVRTMGSPLNSSLLESMGMARSDINYDPSSGTYVMPLTEAGKARLEGMQAVERVVRYSPQGSSDNIFPHSEMYRWNEDNFGPIWVPKKGATVKLTTENLPFYRDIIDKYEANDLEERDGAIYINGAPADSYTFKMDYYFMMGDNRHNSLDSRFWGYVPEDHIVGKASFVWFSVDKEKSFPANIRWSKIFRKIR